MYRNVSFIIFFLLAFGSKLYSQDERTLTYEEAINLALKNNIDLRKQINTLNNSATQNRLSYLGYLPMAGISETSTSSNGRQFDPTKGETVVSSINRTNYNFNISLDLFDWAKRIYIIGETQSILNANKLLYKRSEEQVKYLVSLQYLQILLDEQILNIGEENLKSQNVLLLQIDEYVKTGLRPIVDYHLQLAEVKKWEGIISKSKNQLITDKIVLSQTLQLDPMSDFKVAFPETVKIDSSQFFSTSLFEYQKKALLNRSDYAASNYILIGDKRNVIASNPFYRVNFNVFYNYGSNYSSLLQPRNFSQQIFYDNPYNVVGAALYIPLVNGFRGYGIKASAKMKYRNSLLDRERLEKQIYGEVKKSYYDVSTAFNVYSSSKQQYNSSKMAFEVQKMRYEIGEGTLWEYIQANSSYLQASISYSQADYSLKFQNQVFSYFWGKP